MSINALLLEGWDDTSTWGADHGTLYAQLTPNGVPDDNGPQFWITPPRYAVDNVPDLVRAIAAVTGAQLSDVVQAMRRGGCPGCPAVDFPDL